MQPIFRHNLFQMIKRKASCLCSYHRQSDVHEQGNSNASMSYDNEGGMQSIHVSHQIRYWRSEFSVLLSIGLFLTHSPSAGIKQNSTYKTSISTLDAVILTFAVLLDPLHRNSRAISTKMEPEVSPANEHGWEPQGCWTENIHSSHLTNAPRSGLISLPVRTCRNPKEFKNWPSL